MRRWLAAAVLCGAGCRIDVGAAPDAAPCAATPDFYVSDIWPRYLVANQCANRACHDFSDGHGYLRLRVPESPPPAPGTALDEWPLGWRENYLSTIQLVRCDAPESSRLLSVPEGLGNLHPPGPVVRNRAEAAMLFRTWVAP